MNILLVCYAYPPEVAPGGVGHKELAEDLTRAGHNVTVLTGWPNHPRGVLFPGWEARFRQVERMPEGFRIIRCGHSIHPRTMFWRLLHYFTFAVSSLVNGLAAGPFDAVMDDSTPIFGAWTAWLLARLKGARCVYWIHDMYPETAVDAGLMAPGPLYRLLLWADTVLCRKSDIVATISEAMRRKVLERGIAPEKVVLAPHWQDGRKVRFTGRDNPWRRRQGIPLDKFVALHAGTLGFISGAEVMVLAAENLRNRPDILLLIVGEGVVKEHLVRKAQELRLENVRFLPFQPAEDLADMQSTGDVSLVTLIPQSGENTIPSRVLGYLAAGRPVIASIRGDTPTAEMIRSQNLGIVTPPQEGKALAEAIAYAADHRQEMERIGRNSREFFMSHYDRQVATKVCERLLRGEE